LQNAETVLGILRERGRRGLPCNELYRQMFNPELYLVAYGRIYSNEGAMTPGACGETADGMYAPRGALLYTQRSWEELEGWFLGLMVYLDAKARGKRSLPEKQRSCSGV